MKQPDDGHASPRERNDGSKFASKEGCDGVNMDIIWIWTVRECGW